jgi:hypothetical protein
MPALEQGRSELFLERLHLPRQRGLGQKQLLAGKGEAQVASRRVEPLEQVQRG